MPLVVEAVELFFEMLLIVFALALGFTARVFELSLGDKEGVGRRISEGTCEACRETGCGVGRLGWRVCGVWAEVYADEAIWAHICCAGNGDGWMDAGGCVRPFGVAGSERFEELSFDGVAKHAGESPRAFILKRAVRFEEAASLCGGLFDLVALAL